MTVIEILLLLLIAGITGSIGQALTGFSRGGCFISIIVGFVGALLGTWIARELGLSEIFVLNIGDVAFPVLWAIIGAAIFTGILSLLTPRNKI
ncbi:MAG TPA: GlsB/YeaQ/YmgE family stress response membrane protein [Ignavibacteriaceae bacterium]|nr:GlsB/YeaQ/YmgE family stress response membrane protein [Ignavibacteriaceae bacterium]